MFGPAKRKSLAKIVSIESPSAARRSVNALFSRFKSAKTKPSKLRIMRATVLAGNRAKVMSGSKRLSSVERGQMNEVAAIYRRTAKVMSVWYAGL